MQQVKSLEEHLSVEGLQVIQLSMIFCLCVVQSLGGLQVYFDIETSCVPMQQYLSLEEHLSVEGLQVIQSSMIFCLLGRRVVQSLGGLQVYFDIETS